MDRVSEAIVSVIKPPLTSKETSIILKGQNGSIKTGDLAPVHSPSSKIRGLRKPKMESHSENSCKSKRNDVDPITNSLPPIMKEKLTLGKKSNGNNIGKNGMRLGTTDVEVHFGQQPNNVNKVSFSTPPTTDFYKNPCLASFSHAQLSCLSSQERRNVSSKHPVNSSANTTCTSASNPICSFKPDPLCFKPDLNYTSNGILCNGHTVSEATSSTNSLVISDFSISSEKSTSLDSSFSCSGARPRQKETSNSSSPSLQPCTSSDYDLSNTDSLNTSNSYICKLLDENIKAASSSLPINFSPINPRKDEITNIEYVNYENENQMESIMHLIQKDLSEPYSIYTYRYFIHNWPKLCLLAMHNKEVVGAIVCKLDVHRKATVRGYIAMLAVDEKCRKKRIGSSLVQRAIREMAEDDADEVVLETEITNKPALQLYENLGFVRDKRLFRYYLNGVDALRLKLWLR